MSGDNPYSTSSTDTPSAATNDRSAVTQARSAGTELAQAPPAESMSRAEYASFMRRGPANGTGDARGDSANDATWQAQGTSPSDAAGQMLQRLTAGSDGSGSAGAADHGDRGSDDDPAGTGHPADTGIQPRGHDQAARAQGMTRSENADSIRQGPAAGPGDLHSTGTQDHGDPDEEPGTTHPDISADAGQPQGSGQNATDLHPAAQQAERPTPQAAGAENDGNAPGFDPPSAEASADANSVAATGGGERPPEGPSAGQASHDRPADSGRQGIPSGQDSVAQETPGHEALPGSEPGDAVPAQAAQPAEDHAVHDGASGDGLRQELASLRDQMQAQVDAGLQAAEARYKGSLDNLRADYEAGKAQDRQQIDDLRTELQALKDDRPQPVPDAPGDTGINVDQAPASDRERTTSRTDAAEGGSEGDRPGLWSNAKTALYGAVGTTGAMVVFNEYFPKAPSPVVDVATGVLTIASLLVPVAREGWRRKHDNPPDKP
jgi:hypothetical protein